MGIQRNRKRVLLLGILGLLAGGVVMGVSNRWFKAQEASQELSAWLVDWHWEQGLEDVNALQNLDSLQVFAGYFNHEDQLFFNESMKALFTSMNEIYPRESPYPIYLTLVNDRYSEQGVSLQKDSELLERLFESKESRERHIQEILTIVNQRGFSGVEIDYERVGINLWDRYSLFLEELYGALNRMGKSLRVVLEPGIPIDRIQLPKGPTYVMMVYNLYGYHSGPGPKADNGLIQRVGEKLDQIPGEKYMAFATGGFLWRGDGKIIALTEAQARKMKAEKGGQAQRDELSGSVHFSFYDENQQKHTVWYADEITLEGWIQEARRTGYHKIALWRLGELGEETLAYFNRLK